MNQLTNNKNFLSPLAFRLLIDPTRSQTTEYFVKSVSLPEVSIAQVNLPTPRIEIPFTGGTVEFSPLTVEFFVDEDMTNYQEIYNWVVSQTDNDDSVNKYDLLLMVLSSHNNPNKKIQFYNAFPTSISSLNFDTTSTNITYLTASVTFSYSYFDFVK